MVLSYFLELDRWSPLTFILCKIVWWTFCLVIFLFVCFFVAKVSHTVVQTTCGWAHLWKIRR